MLKFSKNGKMSFFRKNAKIFKKSKIPPKTSLSPKIPKIWDPPPPPPPPTPSTSLWGGDFTPMTEPIP